MLLHSARLAHLQSTHFAGSEQLLCSRWATPDVLGLSPLQLIVRRFVCVHQVADGTVHPLTAYSLSFLKRLFTYESSITVLFADPEATPGLART